MSSYTESLLSDTESQSLTQEPEEFEMAHDDAHEEEREHTTVHSAVNSQMDPDMGIDAPEFQPEPVARVPASAPAALPHSVKLASEMVARSKSATATKAPHSQVAPPVKAIGKGQPGLGKVQKAPAKHFSLMNAQFRRQRMRAQRVGGVGMCLNDVKRLARRGGVKRMKRDEVKRDMDAALRDFLRKVIYDAANYTEHARRKTMHVIDVVRALKHQGKTLYL